MNKIVLIPDSFKGTLSSKTVCDLLAGKIRAHFSGCEIVSIPVADGGEGTVDCFLAALGGEKIRVPVSDPFFQPVDAFYGVLPDHETAVIEVAAAIGLPLVEACKNPLTASSYGAGELLCHAVESGCHKIILGLGGSATNDLGAGLACALGVRFYNRAGEAFIPAGGTLGEVVRIDLTALKKRAAACEIIAMCDVDNPLYGPNGAAAVFGPQKGATPDMVNRLDHNMHQLARQIWQDLGIDVSELPGGGAAGGLGAGVVAFMGGRLEPGIEAVLDTVHFDNLIADADLILTGEGKIDAQSLRGKVVLGVAGRAAKQRKPVIAIVGDIDPGAEEAYSRGVNAILSINKKAVPFETARKTSPQDLAFTADALMRILKMMNF